MWNKDEIKGKGKQIKGGAKDKVGEWTDNKALEEEGERERTEGNVQQTIGKARRKVGEFVDDVKKEVAGD